MPVEIIDYTYLQKRGLVKKEEIKTPLGASITKEGFLKLDEFPQSNLDVGAEEPKSLPAQTAGEGGFFGFLDNPAPSEPVFEQQTNALSEVNALRLKIEDLEFKLSNLLDKFSQIESRLLEFERAAGR